MRSPKSPRAEIPPAPSRAARNTKVLVPQKSKRRFYGHAIPGVEMSKLAGKLFVVEGADGSGRFTQIQMLVDWLEGSGHSTGQVGVKRSCLVI